MEDMVKENLSIKAGFLLLPGINVQSKSPSYSLHFSENGSVCEIDFRDSFAFENIFVVIRALKEDVRYDALRGVLWDLTRADLSNLTLSDLRNIFARQKQVSPTKYLRVACLISSDADSYILRLWQDAGVDGNPNLRRWFLEMDAAREWLASE